ncbi:MAG: hypothetical protein M3R36_17255 [Bacteroidota bacterium]|nr:hypothetical protein [Bacteroidota bacterium]
MITKDKLKSEIDKMSEELIEKIYKLIVTGNKENKKSFDKKVELKSYHLGKELDEIDIRKSAYE